MSLSSEEIGRASTSPFTGFSQITLPSLRSKAYTTARSLPTYTYLSSALTPPENSAVLLLNNVLFDKFLSHIV